MLQCRTFCRVARQDVRESLGMLLISFVSLMKSLSNFLMSTTKNE